MFLSIIPFIKKKVYFFHTSVYFHSHETMWLKIAYQLIESIKWIKQHLKKKYIYIYLIIIYLIGRYYPIFLQFSRDTRGEGENEKNQRLLICIDTKINIYPRSRTSLSRRGTHKRRRQNRACTRARIFARRSACKYVHRVCTRAS